MKNTLHFLTEKQQANRAYYARNAEKIKAQKRNGYQKTTSEKSKLPKTIRAEAKKEVRKKQSISISNPDKPPDPTHTQKLITDEDRQKLKIRRKIEDWQLAKELGIDSF